MRFCLALLLMGLMPITADAQDPPIEEFGNFSVQLKKDPMTDEDQSIAWFDPKPQRRPLGGFFNITGMVKCFGDEKASFALLPGLIGGPATDYETEVVEAASIQYRFDKEKPVTSNDWIESDGWLMPPAEEGLLLARKFTQHDEFIVRLRDSSNEKIGTVTFQLDGAKKAFTRLPCIEP